MFIFLAPSIEIDYFLQDPVNLDLDDGDSSDDGFVPSLYLRYVPSLYLRFMFPFTTRTASNSIMHVP